MLPALSFELKGRQWLTLSKTIQAKLNDLSSVQMNAIKQEIASYLQQSVKRRLRLQRQVSGSAFKQRSAHTFDRSKSRKMLQGLMKSRFLKVEIKQGQVSVGYFGGIGYLARWHNEGKRGNDGKRRPQREWLGFSYQDQQKIQQIFEKYLGNA